VLLSGTESHVLLRIQEDDAGKLGEAEFKLGVGSDEIQSF
jgi:hypothetical protein